MSSSSPCLFSRNKDDDMAKGHKGGTHHETAAEVSGLNPLSRFGGVTEGSAGSSEPGNAMSVIVASYGVRL
jgi:hypothetical protein